jgi:hypothetical protein
MSKRSGGREDGFVLLVILVITGVIGVITLAISQGSRDDYREMKLHLDLSKARLHADNAIVRAIAALGDPSDPLHGVLLQPGAGHTFRLNDIDVHIAIEHESGKIDLNHADLTLISNVLRRMAPETGTADAMLARIEQLRASKTFIDHPDAILSAAQQFDPIAGKIRRLFTVATGARGIAPHLASPEVMAAIPGILPEELALLATGNNRAGGTLSSVLIRRQAYYSPSRPIYTIRARVAGKSLPPLRRHAVIAIGQVPISRLADVALLGWGGENL